MAGSLSEQKRVGKYSVLRTLGRGGAGVVYECLDPDLDRSVAIKTLLPAEDAEGEEQLRRFKSEAQALARLAHQNIVRIYDYDDRTEDYPFIVMEFVEGGSLRQVLDPEHPMPPAQAVALVRQVLAGLAATHRIGIIHRDIKPGNILMRGDHALIADFGIARIADKRSTMVGTVIGTAHYMAPEQLMGAEIDHRADLWSTGVLLYQALTGRQPFDAANALAIMEVIRTTNPRPPSEVNPAGDISGAMDQVVLKSLAKRPEERFESAEAFAQALDDALRTPSEVERTMVMAPAGTPSGGSAASHGGAMAAAAGSPVRQPGRAAAGRSSLLPFIAGGGGLAVLAGVGVMVWVLTSTPTPVPIQRPVEQPPTVTAQADPTTPLPPPVTPAVPSAPGSAALGPAAPGPAVEPPRDAPATPQPPAASLPQPPAVSPAQPPPLVAAPVEPPVQPRVEPVRPAPPVVEAPPAPRLADLRNLVEWADCAVIGGSLEPGRMMLSGVAAADVIAPLRSLWTALRDAEPSGGASRFDVVGMTRVEGLCDALGIVRPLAVPVGSTRRPISVRLDTRAARLRPDVGFSLAVSMPDFAGWVQLDYFSFGDRAVLHAGLSSPRLRQQPAQLPQTIQLNANETAVLFNGTAGSAGEDMVVAVVSRERLFPLPRPEVEDALTYLAALRAAVAAQPLGNVAAHVIPVIIQP